MNEATPTGSVPISGGGGGQEQARIGPVSRFVQALFSPGAVFEDIRRDPRGWWIPILIIAALVTVFATIYVAKYDLGLVIREQLKDHWSMKLAQAFGGPEARDKALEQAVKGATATPVWQTQATQWINFLVVFTLIAWFFTFLYGLIAIVMGWLPPETKNSKLWISLGIVVATGVGFLIVAGALQIGYYSSLKKAGGDAAAHAPPGWLIVTSSILALAATAVILWSLSRLARELPFGRILGVVSYAMAPAAVSALVAVLIVLVRTPDATSMEEIVPSNLTLLLNLKSVGGAIASFGSSLDLFSIWVTVLTIVGLAKALGRKMGEAAGAVLIPWGAWVLLKTVFAAILA